MARLDEPPAEYDRREEAWGEVAAVWHEQRDAWYEQARTEPSDVTGSLLLLAIRQEAASGGHSPHLAWHLKQIEIRSCVVCQADAVWAARTAAGLRDGTMPEALWYAVMLASQCGAAGGPELHAALRGLSEAARQRPNLGHLDGAKLQARIRELLPEPRPDGPVDTLVIAADDAWSAELLPELAGWTGLTAPVNRLLRHLVSATSSKPGKAWMTIAAGMLAEPDALRVLRRILDIVATGPGTPPAEADLRNMHGLVSYENADLVRAAAWAAATVSAGWVVPALQAIAHRGIHQADDEYYISSEKVPNAAIYSLGVIATSESIAALLHLQRGTRNAGFRNQMTTALGAAADRAGLSPSELTERVVPTAGLGDDGYRLIGGDGTGGSARLSIAADLSVLTEWQTPAGWSRRRPAGTGDDLNTAVRAAVEQVKNTIAGERARLEGLLASDRHWKLADWRQLYLSHPITGPISRRLLWTIEPTSAEPAPEATVRSAISTDATTTEPLAMLTGMAAEYGVLLTLTGRQPISAPGTVTLWHPDQAGTEEVRSWRDQLAAASLSQPFKQAYREVYPLTPAERLTGTFSNRFASHILRYPQAYALIRQRGWVANYLTAHHGDGEGRARRDFPDAGLTAVFHHYAIDEEAVEDHRDGEVSICGTGRVLFHRTGHRTRTPIPLDQVPRLVFSEAMRDVDLFVAITSITTDPHWAERHDDPHLPYWHACSFGELSETAAIRREALANLLPKLKISGLLELTDRYIRVRGQLNGYKIHIGSGNILIEPDDRYLCVAPAGQDRPGIMLPFDDDPLLTVILSKAVRLAADNKIADPTIVSQLSTRPSG